jgi:hypothetical protein
MRARSRSPGTSRTVATSAATQTGRLTKNTQRHPGPSEITPPRNTPAVDPSPAIAPHAPNALWRSVPCVKVVVRIDSADGIIIAAPAP